MSLLPKSLLARTALVIVAALIASQAVSVILFRYYSQHPRVQLVATGYLSHLKTIRAALDSIPPAQHREFLARLREERGIRVRHAMAMQAFGDEPLEPAPDMPAIRAVRDRLQEQFGKEAEIYVFKRPPRAQAAGEPREGKPNASLAALPPAYITKLPVGNTYFWVLFPQSRVIEQDFSLAWVGWGIFGGLLALAGALFLVSRVNRPLKALANSAKEIGLGHHPPPVTVMGPTEVQSVALAFNQMRDDLTRQEKERATFLAGVSHDLRTPLARLRLALEMLPADPNTRADLEHDIEDINGIIEQFMDFSREDHAEAWQSVDLNTLVQKAADRVTRMGAHVSLALDQHATLHMRPHSMQRLIANLLDNARKHGGGEILVTTRREGPNIVLSVFDRGPGIPPSEVERLKEPFTRLDAARTGQSGAGLGMAIVERIAKQHRAKFDILPRDGGGTEARVAFPMA